MIKYIIILIIGVLLILALLPSYIRIKGHSMYPTLRDRGIYRVITRPFVKEYKRGDIVVIYVQGIIPYTKRIIAVGGDRLQVTRKGAVTINGRMLNESYVLPKNRGGKAVNMVVPDGCYFVMGDNRAHSTDSRDFGVIERWQLLGKVKIKERTRYKLNG